MAARSCPPLRSGTRRSRCPRDQGRGGVDLVAGFAYDGDASGAEQKSGDEVAELVAPVRKDEPVRRGTHVPGQSIESQSGLRVAIDPGQRRRHCGLDVGRGAERGLVRGELSRVCTRTGPSGPVNGDLEQPFSGALRYCNHGRTTIFPAGGFPAEGLAAGGFPAGGSPGDGALASAASLSAASSKSKASVMRGR